MASTRLSIAAFAVLVAATIAAFFVTQHLKVTTPLLTGYPRPVPGGSRLVKTFLTPWKGQTAVWDGTILGRPAPTGAYLVGIEVTDAACNTGRWPARLPPSPAALARAGVTVQ